jgi:hypothetical protein
MCRKSSAWIVWSRMFGYDGICHHSATLAGVPAFHVPLSPGSSPATSWWLLQTRNQLTRYSPSFPTGFRLDLRIFIPSGCVPDPWHSPFCKYGHDQDTLFHIPPNAQCVCYCAQGWPGLVVKAPRPCCCVSRRSTAMGLLNHELECPVPCS